MTKLRRLDIVVTNPQDVYFPGQVIQGQVVVELSDAMKMRGIQINVRGKGHVFWSSGSGKSKQTVAATEEYIDQSLILCGKGSHESGEMSLPAGNHVFSFQFVLPVSLPGSFEGIRQCYVRYWLKAIIDKAHKPWKFNPECKYVFTVASVLDLNTLPDAAAPAQSSESKTVCCCCCESDPITATFRIDKKGYVPGEAIMCNVEITENTGRGTNGSKIKLVQITTYRTHKGGIRKQKTDCVTLQHGPIRPGESDIWANERLVVPPIPPSFLAGCNIIEIDYYIELKVIVAATPLDLELLVPLAVFIGTIPLQSVVQQYRPQFESGVVTNQPAGYGANVNFDLPPPSYQQCIFGQVDTTDDDDKNASGNKLYAPAYTYYDCLNPPPGGATAPLTSPPTAPPLAYGLS